MVSSRGLARCAAVAGVVWGAFAAPARAGESPVATWPQYAGSPEHVPGDAAATPIVTPRVAWQMSGAVGTPAVRGDRLWVGGEQLFLVDAPSGSIVKAWRPAGEGRFRVSAAPVLDGEQVIVRTADAVVALAADLSKERWRTALPRGPGPGWPSWQPLLHADGAVVLVAGSRVLALETTDGRARWSLDLAKDDEVALTPVAGDGAVYLGTKAGRLLAIDLRKGTPRWSVDVGTEFGWTDPVFAPGRLLLGDRGDRKQRHPALNAFDPKDGHSLWRTEFGSTGLSLPSLDGDTVIAGFGRQVRAFSKDTGALLEAPSIRTGANAFGSPRRIGDAIVFGNLDGHLYAHDAKTGELRWALEMAQEKAQFHAFVVAGDRWYVASSVGLFAIENDPRATVKPGNVVRVPW